MYELTDPENHEYAGLNEMNVKPWTAEQSGNGKTDGDYELAECPAYGVSVMS